MKMVIAYIQTFMMEKVMKALQDIPGVPGASVMECRGFGRGRARGESAVLATEVATQGTLRKLRVETMIPDELEDRVVRAIREAALTGNRGDGKVYVASLERAMRIRTAEEGDAAL